MPTLPKLSYVCPLAWNDLRGEESARFCPKCSRTVVNLSLLTEEDRTALLARAYADGNGLCVAYYRHLSGEPPSAEVPSAAPASRVAFQLGATALTAAALAVGAHQAPAIHQAMDSAQAVAANAYVAWRDQTIGRARQKMADVGRLFGGKPHEPEPPVMLMGMLSCPPPPAASPSVTVPRPPPAATATAQSLAKT